MTKTRVVGYTRVSTEGQADSGISLEAQRSRLAAYAQAMDLELVAVEEDAGRSARTIEGRPGLLRALARLDDGSADGMLLEIERHGGDVEAASDAVLRYPWPPVYDADAAEAEKTITLGLRSSWATRNKVAKTLSCD